MTPRLLCAAALATLCHLPVCHAAAPASAAPAAGQTDLTQAPRMGTWGFDLAGRDTAVKPGVDFYKFSNGAWDARTAIPSDRSEYGVFETLADLSRERSRAIIEKAAAEAATKPEAKQVGAMYQSFMDEKRIAAVGKKPLAADLEAVKAAKTRDAIAALMGESQKGFGTAFFSMYIGQHAKSPERYVTYLNQGGLGLPDRDYYLTAQFAEKKAAYEKYVAKLLGLAGWPQAVKQAAAIVELETQIALVSWTRVEQRDAVKTWNPVTRAELAALSPGFPWEAFFKAADLPNVKDFVIGEPSAFTRIGEVFALTPIETLQAFCAFHVADQAATKLPKAFDQAHFEFWDKTLSGQPEQEPRWKRGVRIVNGTLGEIVGRLYVEKYFPATSKAKMEALVADLVKAMGARIDRLDWMGPATKKRAQEKLAKFNVKIGYPDQWRDYSALTVDAGDVYGNVERAAAFEWNFRVSRLDKPVDRKEWGMTPQTVNAYYDPTMNEIVFPAAILQPPFFDPEADPAVNYGAIGGVIGHEITHGFDDQGRQFDATGRLSDWWAPEDAERFVARTKALAAQYSAVEVLPGAKVNGDLTLGENIADLGGVLLGLDAYQLSLGGKPAPVLDGVTGEQRVLLGWAQVWRGKYRDDALRQQVASDPHSPVMLRVNGVVRNVDAWYTAFGVQAGEGLFLRPEARVRIW
jgi:putative endopeptidase